MKTTLKLSILFFSVVLLTGFKYTDFDFAKILSQDRETLQQGQFLGDTSKIKLFDKFVRQDISKFEHSSKDNGNHHIDIWTSNNSKIIKISSKIPIDTVVYRNELNGTRTNPKNIKVTFEFITYQFTQLQVPQKLTYLTIKHEGLSEYSIDDKEYQISYVSAFVGMDLVYNKTKKEVMTILTQN